MKRRTFVQVAGLAAVAVPIRTFPVVRSSPFPLPPSPSPPFQADPVADALAALAQAKHPGALSDADLAELKRQLGYVLKAADALRAVKLTNADGPACVAHA